MKGSWKPRSIASNCGWLETALLTPRPVSCDPWTWHVRSERDSLELRAAADLARLWAGRGDRARAVDLLGPIYGWSTEGLDTADLKEAMALLDELAH